MRKALYLLGILDDVDIEWLAEHGTMRLIETGSVLIEEKHPIDSLYILLEGQLSVTVGGPQGTHIANLHPGEIVGEISFVDTRPPSASVVAVRDSQILALSREALQRKLARDHGFAERFYRSIAKFLADRLWVTVGRFGYGSARQDVDVDELPDASFDEIDLAAVRFDKFLKRVRGDYMTRTAAH
jgi:CRP-like cAMP-binding protein